MNARRWAFLGGLGAATLHGCSPSAGPSSESADGAGPFAGDGALAEAGGPATGSSESGSTSPSSSSSGVGPASGSGRDAGSGADVGTSSGVGAGSGADAGGDSGASAGGTDAAPGVVAATPPMGWNSWNTFQCNITEALIKATADAMVSSGMQAAGYEYVNLDDCWMNGRDSNGNLQWNASKFPSGLPALADYVHGKGLKFGIYETPNTVTCVGIYGGTSPSVAVGSLGHEAQDARTFASWGVDYLKYDLCQGKRSSFAVMRDALRATGRAIVFSINPGNGSNDLCPPNGSPPDGSSCGLTLPSTANLWRIGFDISASWSSITSLVDQDAPLSRYAGPGHWNDPDMLEVGNGGLSADENRSHLSMWAMLAAPLLAGNDLRSMSSDTKATLTNQEITAVDQDALGAQATLVATPQSGLQVWSKPLVGGNVRAVALLNRNSSSASISVDFTKIGLSSGAASVRDLWQHADLGMSMGSYTATSVSSHGVVVLRIAQ
ncbi:MAG TPA: glycoside hydrolase family 27 protein [Polyangiaceae bacterium]|nr:glycoside hydrolase family 27 protein [Polyangiaceae bacterium]